VERIVEPAEVQEGQQAGGYCTHLEVNDGHVIIMKKEF
jgi:hypothetical protein